MKERCPKCGMDEEGLIQELIEMHERNCKGIGSD